MLLEDADAYAGLAGAELTSWGRQLQQRTMFAAAAALFALLGLGLAGVAGLLAAALPWQTMPMRWVLWALPLALLLLAAFLAWRAHQLGNDTALSTLRGQIAQDLATLKLLDEEA